MDRFVHLHSAGRTEGLTDGHEGESHEIQSSDDLDAVLSNLQLVQVDRPIEGWESPVGTTIPMFGPNVV
jgi:hypothetical protein